MMTDSGCRLFLRAVGRFFEYDTPKIVHIRSLRVGILFRLVQLAILVYVIGYMLVYKKSYQETDEPESSVESKVKGVVLTNASVGGFGVKGVRVWDPADYIVPPQENGAFFVMTNMIVTANQEQGICPEAESVQTDPCYSDSDCSADENPANANGVRTGSCNTTTHTCSLFAWCPVEKDKAPSVPVLAGTEDFTVLVKNQIVFPKFGVRRRNILDSIAANDSYLKTCRYDPVTDQFCPIFTLGRIVELAGENYTALATSGAIMGFVIEWDCNLDFSVEYCVPKYSFRRIDNKDDRAAPGWNFRYANFWTDTVNGASIQRRTLTKAYGIRFMFFVYGKAGKFGFVPFAMNLGAGLALLSLSIVICDVILLYCTKRRQFYSENKYYTVKDADALLIEESQTASGSYRYEDFR